MNRLLARPWLWGLVSVLAAAGVLWVYVWAESAKDLADPERARRAGRPIPVRTAAVEESDFEEVFGGTALTVPSEIAPIRLGPSRGFKVNDPVSELRILRVNAHEGDRVRKGQLLFEVDDRVFQQVAKHQEIAVQTAVAELERVTKEATLNKKLRALDLAAAQSGLTFRRAELDNRTKAFDVAEKLYRHKATSVLEYYEVRSQLVQASFQLSDAEFHLQRARDAIDVGRLSDEKNISKATNDLEVEKLDLDVARRDLERCHMRSPLDGYVGKVETAPGAIIGISDALTHIEQTDPLHVRVDLPQEHCNAIAIGQPAEITLDSHPGETFPGTTIRISAHVNPDLRILPVVVELRNPDNRLKTGVSGFVRFRRGKRTTSVPSVSVLRSGERAMVFRVEKGRARIREIRPGNVLEVGRLEVLQGLSAGDQVVVFQNFYRHSGELTERNCYLQDNDPVDVEWRKWARRE